jgi:hypothetical protein
LAEDPNLTKRSAVLLGASCVAFIVLGLVCTGMVKSGLGPWLELFNGATWPGRWIPKDAATQSDADALYGFWFFAALTMRTAINLGFILSALGALFWVLTGGLGRLVMKQLETLSKMRTAALVGEMLVVLEAANIDVPEDVEKRMFEAAREFDKTSLGTAIKKRMAEVAQAPA